jgi:pimeloyl-ACP methyl ester carboxylesterase
MGEVRDRISNCVTSHYFVNVAGAVTTNLLSPLPAHDGRVVSTDVLQNMPSRPTTVAIRHAKEAHVRPTPDDAPRSTFVSAQDGLRLHVRQYGPRTAAAVPVVCLPGLTRTTADFDVLAPALAYGQPNRRVIAIDSRGRGQSEYDVNPENYNLKIELADVISVLAALEIGQAVFVGSSRGGLLSMLLAVAQPTAIAGVVLHDIGPVIEPKGLARIKSYVGKLPQPGNFAEGAEILRRLFDVQFPKLTADQWLAAAEHTWRAEGGKLVLTYDLRLARTLAEFDVESPLSPMWNEFDALARVPVLVIRGANSDILSADTVGTMRRRHPGLTAIEVADQGHVPLLDTAELIERIAGFVRGCDVASRGHTAASSSRALLREGESKSPATDRRRRSNAVSKQ